MKKQQGSVSIAKDNFIFVVPKSCPYPSSWCYGCGYCEKRKPTEYYKMKMKILKEL